MTLESPSTVFAADVDVAVVGAVDDADPVPDEWTSATASPSAWIFQLV